MKKYLIIIIMLALMIPCITSCKSDPAGESPVIDTEEESDESIPESAPIDEVSADTLFGKWERVNGDQPFTYELLEDGTLVVHSETGEFFCKWNHLGANEVTFDYDDHGTVKYLYDQATDSLILEDDLEEILKRVEESGMPDSIYTIGGQYVLQEALKVREYPSVDARWKKVDELSEAERKLAMDGEDAVLPAGTEVTCQAKYKEWIRIESGWLYGGEDGHSYIVLKESLNRKNSSILRLYEKLGVDYDSAKMLSGTYKIKGSGLVSAEFSEDGTVIVLFDKPSVPVTDDDGYTNGYYVVKDDKVYMQFGGSVTAHAYSISGKTLRDLSEEINVM